MTPPISSTKAVPSASPYTEVRTVPNRCECVAESKSGNYWDDEPLREEILKAKANQQKEWWIPRPGHSLDLWGRLLSDTFGLAGDGEILPDNLDDTLPAHVVAAEIYNARYPLTGVVRYLRLSECVGRPLWPLTDCALVVIDLIPGNSSKLVREAFPERARALDRLIRSSTTPTHKEEEPHIKQEGGKEEEEEEEEPVKELVRYPFIRVFCTWGDKEHPDPSLDECREIVTQLGMTDEARRTCRAFFLARGSRVGIYTWDRSGQGRTVLPLRVTRTRAMTPSSAWRTIMRGWGRLCSSCRGRCMPSSSWRHSGKSSFPGAFPIRIAVFPLVYFALQSK